LTATERNPFDRDQNSGRKRPWTGGSGDEQHARTGVCHHSVDRPVLAKASASSPIGMIDGALRNNFGANAVRYSLLSAEVTTTLGALLFIWAAGSIRGDIKRAV
jgi:hypothetical protein